MSRISTEKKLPRYHEIYEHIYETPDTPLYQITKETGISRSTISRYLKEMYELSIIRGPMLFLKPAQNYHQYACLLKFSNPMDAYRSFAGFPHVRNRTLCAGTWNLMLICERPMDFSQLKGFQKSVLQGAKGVTHLSKVGSLNWDSSMAKIYNMLSFPEEKTTLYEEIPENFWEEPEWALFNYFKNDIRKQAMPVLKEFNIRFERYQEWVSRLQEVAVVQAAFYPEGLDAYIIFDLVFKSDYHRQLADVLGKLPSTSVLFSVGSYLLVRLFLLNKKEKDDVFSLLFRLGELNFFTDFYHAVVVATSD
ncbi:MAG: winged helix-turn-helix domain-containing protein [Candidatus Methanofastidiosia archaeon]